MLYTSLVTAMDKEAADILMEQMPLGGWSQMATRDDLTNTEQRLQAALQIASAETSTRFAETNTKIAETDNRLAAAMQAGFAEAAKERAAATQERAKIVRAQARQLYFIVATIVTSNTLAAVSIWIALSNSAAGL